jgi:hypothetical protein
MPPAAAAAVAVANPSQSVRPGSLTWTWESTSAGMTRRCEGCAGCSGGSGRTAAMRSPAISISAGWMPVGRRTRAERIIIVATMTTRLSGYYRGRQCRMANADAEAMTKCGNAELVNANP